MPACQGSALGLSTVQGRDGAHFRVWLESVDGAEVSVGDAQSMGSGMYLATYTVPRQVTDGYQLHVALAEQPGLAAQYFNNRWLLDEPDVVRVDAALNFSWPDFVTPTGRDYVSARWTGFIMLPYNETYTFELDVNDGGRVVVDRRVLLDELDVASPDETLRRVRANSTATFPAQRLLRMLVEWRENVGNAGIRLRYSSPSLVSQVVPPSRLFSRVTPIRGSPWRVRPVPIVATQPLQPALTVHSAQSLQLTWEPPADDGGSAVEGYLVRWWTAAPTAAKEVQTLVVANATRGGFTLHIPGVGTTVQLAYNDPALVVQDALQQLPGMSTVSVSCNVRQDVAAPCDARFAASAGIVRYRVTFTHFVTSSGATSLPTMQVVPTATMLNSSDLWVHVCADGVVSTWCGADDSANGTQLAGLCAHAGNNGTACPTLPASARTYIISNLVPGTAIQAVVIPLTQAGVGAATDVVMETPRAVPLQPRDVQLHLVPASDAQLKVYWLPPVSDEGSPITAYEVTWSTSSTLQPATSVARLALADVASPRVDAAVMEWTIPHLVPGTRYYACVAAVNAMGVGACTVAQAGGEQPRTRPDAITYGNAIVRTRAAGTEASVGEAISSLQVLWTRTNDAHGANVSHYLVAWYTAPGRPEVQILRIADAVGGTLRVEWDGETTDHIPHDASAATMKRYLESLPDLLEVNVERVDAASAWLYYVTFVGVVGDLSAPLTLHASLQPVGIATASVQRGLSASAAGPVWTVVQGDARLTAAGDATSGLRVGAWAEVRTALNVAAHYSIERITAIVYDSGNDTTTLTLASAYAGSSATGAYLLTGDSA
ncbi:hypothetical protein EON62_01430, partial [archaeon]